MPDALPFDPTTIESVTDVQPHYEAKECVTHAVDAIVDPEVVRGYTFQHVFNWNNLLAVAGDVYAAGHDAEGRLKVYPDKAMHDRGIEYTSPKDRAVRDILDTLRTDGSFAPYQTDHPMMAQRFPSCYPNDAKDASDEQAAAFVGALLADRLGRFEALETLRTDPNTGAWMPAPPSKESYIRSYELDHVSAMFELALDLGNTRWANVHINTNNEYGVSDTEGKIELRKVQLERIHSPAIAVSTLRTAFGIYEDMTAHYEAGILQEEAASPRNMPEIALAHEYIYTAATMADHFAEKFAKYKQDTDRFFAAKVDNRYVDSYLQDERLDEGAVRKRDMYGDALAGLRSMHEEAVFALGEKFGARVDYISRRIGMFTEQHAEQYEKLIDELACIREVLQAATSSEHLPVNSVMQGEIDGIIAKIGENAKSQDYAFHWRHYRYACHADSYNDNDARREKRLFRRYPPNRQAVYTALIA